MVALLLLVAGIAAVDALNPSTLLPGLYLAGAPRARGLASFALGVFAVNLAAGLVLVLGPGPALIRALEHVGPVAEHVVEIAAGTVFVAISIVAWRSRDARESVRRATGRRGRASAFALGAAIAAIELPTAFMYLGAVSAIIVSPAGTLTEVLLVAAYCAIVVAPLGMLLAVRRRTGEVTERRLAAARRRLRSAAPRALATVAGVGGTTLALVGVGGLV